MWALSRASLNSLKAPGLKVTAFRACTTVGPYNSRTESTFKASELHYFKVDRWITSTTCNCPVTVPKLFSVGHRSLSSQAGAKSGGEEIDELEDGFSELEEPEASTEADIKDGESSSDSTSDSESDPSSLDASLEDTLETDPLGDAVEDAGNTASKNYASALLKFILKLSGSSISGALDKFVKDRELTHTEVYEVLTNLRRRKLFVKALQLSEWLDARNNFDFTERDYATKVDLLARASGIQKAESYFHTIPKSFKNEVVYRSLLASFVSVSLVDKSEKLFNKMKDSGLPMTIFTVNQMLVLYKRADKKKIANILEMMEKENLKPSLFTYQVLIEAKGQSHDIRGMEQIVEAMKVEGLEPDLRVQAVLASHYATAGFTEKAEAVLKEMEGKHLKIGRPMWHVILPIYADLGKAKEVERIWKIAESKPRQVDFIAAVTAWGKLKNIEQAEAIFNKMTQKHKQLSAWHYNTMLKVYAENKMLSKGKELLKQMTDGKCVVGPMAWDALVKLHVDAGEVEQADLLFHKASQKRQLLRPMFSTYISILDGYSKKGDIDNAEKIFQMLKKDGYVVGAKPFSILLQTYINAKVPAYGIQERMKADNLKPGKGLVAQLALVDAFRKTSASK